MGVSKVTLNGETQISVIDTTVDTDNLLEGKNALRHDGIEIEGTIVLRSSSDIISHDSVILVPAGFYPEDTSRDFGGGGGGIGINSLTVTPTTERQIFYASLEGYEGYSPVTINAMPAGQTGSPILTKSEVNNNSVIIIGSVTNTTGYITGGVKIGDPLTVSAAELVSGKLSITNNSDNIDVTNYASVSVNVAGGGGSGVIKSLFVTPNATRQVFDATQEGADGYNTVTVGAITAGQVGVPYALKGSVTNHSINIIPRVNVREGYVTSSTITGDSITVYASELISGNKDITSNGVVDVAGYATVTVNVPLGGNGGYTWQDADGYVHFSNNESSGGGGGGIITPLTVTAQDYQQVIDASTSGTDGYNPITVSAIPGNYVGYAVQRRTSEDVAIAGASIAIPAGYYESPVHTSVAIGELGTPTFSRVDGYHSVQLTPRVSNTIGYIVEGNKSGDPVTISASDLVSDDLSITYNDDYIDVTEYATVSVHVTPSVRRLTVTPSLEQQVFDATEMVGYNDVGFNPVTVAAMPTGNEGIPTFNVTVSADGHSKTLTPIVTNSAGYISATAAITGTPETIYASDLVSGHREITGNAQNIDVTELASITVNVDNAPSIEPLTITPTESILTFDARDENASGYNTVTVNAIPSNYIGTNVPQKDSSNLISNVYYAWMPHFTGENITLSQAANVDTARISIQGTTLTGYLAIGDEITIDGYTYEVISQTSEASSNTLLNVIISPDLRDSYPIGTSVSINAADPYVTAPSGYYAANATKLIRLTDHPQPTITVNSSTGRITSSHTQSAGYLKANHTSSISTSLSTLGTTTYYPSTTDQTISSNKYLTGIQTIKALTITNLTAANIAEGVTIKIGDSDDDDRILSITGTHSGGSGGGSGGVIDNVTTLPSGGDYHEITAIEISGTREITVNGTYDVTSYANVLVNVAASAPNLQTKTNINPTTTSQTITADSGYAGLASVQINAMPPAVLPTTTTTTQPSGTTLLTIDRNTSTRYLQIPAGYSSGGYYTISAVANGSVSVPATTISVTPSISINSSGLITASVSGTESVSPNVSSGYVTSGSAGTMTVSGSNTSQLTTLAATTYHPSTSNQTITSGKYITGTQTFKAVTVSNLNAENIKSGVVIKIGDSDDDDCIASVAGSYVGESISLQTITDITPTESSQTIIPDSNYNGIASVQINAISNTYVGTGITLQNSSSLTASGATVTAPAGYYSSAASKSVTTTSLPSSLTTTQPSGTAKITIGRSTSTRYLSISEGYQSGGYYTIEAVSNGTAGTPTATKGSVSDHSISVTPSVTNTTGYITGSTKTGTAVTVSASELVSGTYSISMNGTSIDVTNYKYVDVAVSSTATAMSDATILSICVI